MTARITTPPEDHFPSAGYRDAIDAIGAEVQSMSRTLSALESRKGVG